MTSTLDDSRCSLWGKTRSPDAAPPNTPDTGIHAHAQDRHSIPTPPPPCRRFTLSVRSLVGLSALALAGGAFLGVPGGSSAGRTDVSETTARPGAAPASMTMTGTLRDLEPAIRFAASEHEMAILTQPKPDAGEPNLRRFDLITVVDEPVTLTIHLPEGAAPPARTPGLGVRLVPSATPLSMTASMQIAFGYPDRERAFLTTLRDRLSALEKGDGIAKGPD